MVTLDYILIAVVLLSALVGVFRGFLLEVCSLVTWILAVWLAWHFAPALAPKLGGVLKQAPYGLWAARSIIFLTVVVAGWIIGAIINHFVRLSMFSGLDRLLGFVLGFGRGLVIVGVAIILAQSARVDQEAWWQKSRLAAAFTPMAGFLRALVGDHLPTRAASER
jgi:membrane protein required for colicin V production